MKLTEFEVAEWLAFVNMPEDNVDICAQFVDNGGDIDEEIMIPHHSRAWKNVQEVYVDTVKVEQNKLVLCITLFPEDKSVMNLKEGASVKKVDPVFEWRFVFDLDLENGGGLDFDVFEGRGTLRKFLKQFQKKYVYRPSPDIIEDDKGKKWNLDDPNEYAQILTIYPIEKIIGFFWASDVADYLTDGNILYANVNGKEPEGLDVHNYYDYVDMSSGDADELEHDVDSTYELGFFDEEDEEEDE